MKQFESFAIDMSNECLWHKGGQLDLPPKPFAVLRYLVDHPGRLITHDELMDALWPETYVQPQVLRTYMLDLRKLLGDDAGEPKFIQTVPKRGYRFVAEVREVTDQAAKDGAAPDRAAPGRDSKERRATDQIEALFSSNHAATSQNNPQVTETPRIVDRKEELGLLNAHVRQISGGQRQVVFLTGEAGIGKTALVDAFCKQFDASTSATVARGQCVEGFGPKEEYYPVMEALSQLCASPEGDRACRILARMAPAWLSATGRESGPIPTAGRPASPERMPGDLCAALEELAAEKPLILVIEDLHWGDPSTLHLISALARRRAPAKLMVLATFNCQHVNSEHPLKALNQDLRMRRLGVEIALAPLSRAAVSELLSRELNLDASKEALPQGLSSFIHRHSEGNPLFVIALLEHLIAQRHLVREGVDGAGIDGTARWEQRASFQEMEADVPDGLAQMVELEIARLSDAEQRTLEAGSLINIAFPAWAAAAALEKDEAETEEACDGLTRRVHFVQQAGQDELPDGSSSTFYAFAHGMYREVLYRRQPAARRAKGHIRIAERLGQLFAGREANVAREIAMHYEAACHWPRTIGALRTAARYAVERQASAESAELLEHALRIAENLSKPERVVLTEEIQTELTAARETLTAAVPVKSV
jgi:predicted ATPase/DNA-binding winged helix-turn-helix (wHTH) protein